MRCPRCGNEISQDEAFCGQCGAPIVQSSQPTAMVNAPASRNGVPGTYNTGQLNNAPLPPTQGLYQQPNQQNQQMSPSGFYNQPTMQAPPSGPLAPNQANQAPFPQSPQFPQPQQQSGFYQDATEAMTVLPNGQGYPQGYQQPSYPVAPTAYPGASQYGAQSPFQAPGTPQTNYPPSATPPVQGYGYNPPSHATPPPKKQPNGLLVFATVCLVVAIIAVAAFGAIYLLRNHSPKTNIPAITPTSAVAPTAAPSPTPSPSPTPMPTSTPTPAPSPTPAPDAGFAWCSICTPNGFLVEYPQGWTQANDSAPTNVRFFNTNPTDQYAEFKTPGATTSSASQLVAADLQSTFASQPGYVAPTTSSTATIGGENWTYEVATYQLNGQPEQVQVYATVHQQKAYIIELQAAASQFNTVNTQFFTVMLGRFSFTS